MLFLELTKGNIHTNVFSYTYLAMNNKLSAYNNISVYLCISNSERFYYPKK